MDCTVCDEILARKQEDTARRIEEAAKLIAKEKEDAADLRNKKELKSKRWRESFCDWDAGQTIEQKQVCNKEKCYVEFCGMTFTICAHEGCTKKTHKICQDWWLEQHSFPQNYVGDPVVCREHSKKYQDWLLYRAGKLSLADLGTVPGLFKGYGVL